MAIPWSSNNHLVFIFSHLLNILQYLTIILRSSYNHLIALSYVWGVFQCPVNFNQKWPMFQLLRPLCLDNSTLVIYAQKIFKKRFYQNFFSSKMGTTVKLFMVVIPCCSKLVYKLTKCLQARLEATTEEALTGGNSQGRALYMPEILG